MRRRLWLAIQLAFGAAGLTFLVLAFVDTWRDTQADVLPSSWRLGAALVASASGMACAASAWLVLLGSRRRSLAAGFFMAQLGKYIPGGFWQVAGQVGLARRDGVPLARASVAFPVHAIVNVAAGGVVALSYVVLGTGARRWMGLLGLLTLPLLHRGWMIRSAGLVARLRGRTLDPDVVPPQRAIFRAMVWSIATLVAAGIAFALVAPGIAAPVRAVVPAWGVAWTIGFLVLIVPAGLGAREAALVAALGPFGSTAGLVAASVIHRIVTMVAEMLMIVVSHLWARAGGEVTTSLPGRNPGTSSPA